MTDKRKERKDREIKFRLSGRDYEDLERRMERMGITNRAEFCRLCIRDNEAMRQEAIRVMLRKIRFGQRRIESRLEQIVKNMEGRGGTPDLKNLKRQMEEIRGLCEKNENEVCRLREQWGGTAGQETEDLRMDSETGEKGEEPRKEEGWPSQN